MRRVLWLLTCIPALAVAGPSYDIDLTDPTQVAIPLRPLSQTDWHWGAFPVGPANKVIWGDDPLRRVDFKRCGCFLTTLAMATTAQLNAVSPWFPSTQITNPHPVTFAAVEGFHPKYLDDFFNYGPGQNWSTGWAYDPNSGGERCGVYVAPFTTTGIGYDQPSQQTLGVTWAQLQPGPAAWDRVDAALVQGRPTLVNRKSRATDGSTGGKHYNIIVGWNAAQQKYVIWDPMWELEKGGPRIAGHGFDGNDPYQAWKDAVEWLFPIERATPSWLLRFQDDPEPIELCLTDPRGRRTGFDPATGRNLQEDLDAAYVVEGSYEDPLGLIPYGEPNRSLTVRNPEPGTYGLEVFGTGDGAFTLRVGGSDGGPFDVQTTLTGMVTNGAVRRYEVHVAAGGLVTSEEVSVFAPRAQAGNGAVAFVGDDVAFDGRGSYQIGGAISSYSWTFGDGAGATGAQATHAYASAGTFAAQLTVQNADGLTATATRQVLVVSPAAAETTRVSVAANGAAGDAGSTDPVLAAAGRWVAFASYASSLVPDDTNSSPDVFVKDLQTGAIERVSVAPDGAQAQGGYGVTGSSGPSISADGRYVAFVSDAPNLEANDTDGAEHVFVRDRTAGTTEVVSLGTAGTVHEGRFPSISADGRYVAFQSAAALNAGDPEGRGNIYVRDRQTSTTVLASATWDGAYPQSWYYGSVRPAISGDGRYVVFASDVRNLTNNDPWGYSTDVFVRDLQTNTTEMVSVDSSATSYQATSWNGKLSHDGRYVVFMSMADALVADDTNGTWDVFLRDRQLGTTARVTLNSLGEQADNGGWDCAFSPNGRFVTFYSRATNLAPSGANVWQAYLRDLQSGETSRLSVATAGDQASPSVLTPDDVTAPAWPANDGTVAFQSTATNLVAGDTNAASDVFVRRSTASAAATTPLANLGGPYVGWATSPAVPTGIQLDGRASRDPQGRALTARWDFGDGTPETAAALLTTHAYAVPGRYTVTLRVQAESDVSAAATTEVDVLDHLPAEQVTASSCVDPGTSFTVTGASPAANAALVAAGWDRTTGRLAAAAATLTLPWGTIDVPLALPAFSFATTVTVPPSQAAGQYAISTPGGATANVTVPCAPITDHPPLAHAGGPAYYAKVGETITLDGSASTDPEGAPLTYWWSLGDGATATGVQPAHAWLEPGDYLIKLIVNDGTLDSAISPGSHSFALAVITEDPTDGGADDAGADGGGPEDGGADSSATDAGATPPSTSGCGCRHAPPAGPGAFALILGLYLTLPRSRRRSP